MLVEELDLFFLEEELFSFKSEEETFRATEEDETPTTAAELLPAAPSESEFGEKAQEARAKASAEAAAKTEMVLIFI